MTTETTPNEQQTEKITGSASRKTSAFFLVQGSYSSYTWMYFTAADPGDFRNPPDIPALFMQLGVTIHGIWYSFGEYDLVMIVELENAGDMAGVVIALKAGWEGKTFDNLKITPLLGQDAITNACLKASDGLRKCRDASQDGSLKGTMDYTTAAFSNGKAK